MLVYKQNGDEVFNLDKVADIQLLDRGQWKVYVHVDIVNFEDMSNTHKVYTGTEAQCRHILNWLVQKSRNSNFGNGDSLDSDYLTKYGK